MPPPPGGRGRSQSAPRGQAASWNQIKKHKSKGSFIYSCIIHWIIHLMIYFCIPKFIHSFIQRFIYSFFHVCIYSTHSYIHAFNKRLIIRSLLNLIFFARKKYGLNNVWKKIIFTFPTVQKEHSGRQEREVVYICIYIYSMYLVIYLSVKKEWSGRN